MSVDHHPRHRSPTTDRVLGTGEARLRDRPRLAVILAAGKGSRISDHQGDRPKGLIHLGDESLVGRSVRLLEAHGIERVVIGTGHKREFYEDSFLDHARVTCVFNPRYGETGSLVTLLALAPVITEDFLLLESDLIYEPRALDAILATSTRDGILGSGFTRSGDEVFLEAAPDGTLSRLSKDRDSLQDPVGELVGISKVSIETFQSLESWATDHADQARHAHYEEGLAAISLLGRAIPIHLEPDLIWSEIDTKEHLERVVRHILPRLQEPNRGPDEP